VSSLGDWLNELLPNLPPLQNPIRLWCSAFAEGLRLDPDRTVSQWADANRILSKMSSPVPGPWRTEVSPFLREPMDALSPSDPTPLVVMQASTQVGKSETGNNWIGSIIDQGLGPSMIVLPTSNAAKKASRTRIGPMIQETPSLRDKVREAKSRDSGNTILLKEFDGGVLVLAGANSATELKSTPVRNLFLDEIEEYPADVDGQGDPEDLAERRTDRFARRKVFKCSTPTIVGGRIDRAYKASDQRLYFVPCPHCGHEQPLRFEQLRWETRKVWERTDPESGEISVTEPEAPGASERDTGELTDVHYECAGCRQAIYEHVKTEMLARGRWVAQNPGPDRAKGYKLNALYIPIGARMTWRQVVLEFFAAERDTSGTKKKTFSNTVLGEAYDEAGESIEPHFLKARIEPAFRIGGMVPAKCLLLACGVDVQHNRLEAYVWGFGRDLESWVVERQIIFGSPALEETWKALEDLLAKGWAHAGGQSLRLTRMAIDASDGVTTHYVRVFVRKWAYTGRVIAVKGQAVAGKALIGKPTKQDINYRGEILKQGVEIWQYGSDTAKGALYARLKIEQPGAGYVHIPSGLPDEFFEQLTAEKRVTRYLRGQPRVEWVLERGRRNEALDCAGMAHAAAESAGLSRVNWDMLERLINPNQQDLFAAPTTVSAAPDAVAQVALQPPAAVQTSALPAAHRGRRIRGGSRTH
jgi:phage terminase large subunit GpA-like protein